MPFATQMRLNRRGHTVNGSGTVRSEESLLEKPAVALPTTITTTALGKGRFMVDTLESREG